MAEFNVSLHPAQLKIFNSESRFKVLCCGRRFGKTSLLLQTALYKILTFDQKLSNLEKKPVVAIIAPSLAQCKELYWADIERNISDIPLVKSYNKTTATVEFYNDLPSLILKGALGDKQSRVRGQRYYFVGVDEYQDFPYGLWQEGIYPGLADTLNSSAIICGTPKGKNNVLHKIHELALTEPDWEFFNFPSWANPKPEVQQFIESSFKTLPRRVFNQEFRAKFVDSLGLVYSEFTSKNIIPVSQIPQTFDQINIGLDNGEVHPALVVVGTKSDRHYILETWEGGDGRNAVSSSIVENKVVELAKKYKVEQVIVDPARPSVVLDLRERGKRESLLGLRKAVGGYNKIVEGNSTVNALFYQGKLLVSDSLVNFINQASSYHRKIDKNGNVLDVIAEGQVDHLLDANRYLFATKYCKAA